MERNHMHKIGILTSGGDAPGMNACIRALVRGALRHKIEVVGIRRGYKGLLKGDSIRLDLGTVANILQQGGTFLGTARCEEMKTVEGRKKAIQFLHNEEIDGLITVGGDGTFRGAVALSQEGQIKVVGIPATIDNDVYGTDYAIGFDTAINTALQSIDKIRDTAQSLERLFFIEVMGRTRGFIALEVGIAGGATDILIPETETNIEKLCQELEHSFRRGKQFAIVIVAEGDTPGGALPIAQEVGRLLGIDYRVCVLGHVQRGGMPTARDRVLASKLGVAAVDALVDGRDGCMVGEMRGEIAYTPLEDTWQKVKELPRELLELGKILAI
jgi:6-phosphofructokinase 1